MHIALGGLAAAALAAHDTVVFGLLELRRASVLQLLLPPSQSYHGNMRDRRLSNDSTGMAQDLSL